MASQPKLAPFVIQALIQVIAKITKLGWFDVLKDQLIFREIVADVKKFLQVGNNHSLLPFFFSCMDLLNLVIGMLCHLVVLHLGGKSMKDVVENRSPYNDEPGQFHTWARLWLLMPRSIHSAVVF